jgi:hypothetical protein
MVWGREDLQLGPLEFLPKLEASRPGLVGVLPLKLMQEGKLHPKTPENGACSSRKRLICESVKHPWLKIRERAGGIEVRTRFERAAHHAFRGIYQIASKSRIITTTAGVSGVIVQRRYDAARNGAYRGQSTFADPAPGNRAAFANLQAGWPCDAERPSTQRSESARKNCDPNVGSRCRLACMKAMLWVPRRSVILQA